MAVQRAHTLSYTPSPAQTRVNLNWRDYARSALVRFIGNPRARLYGNVGQIYHSGLTVQFSYLRAAGSGSRGLLKNRTKGGAWRRGGGPNCKQNNSLTLVKLFHDRMLCLMELETNSVRACIPYSALCMLKTLS